MATGWLRGTVKAVISGDCLLVMGNVKSGPPPEKQITLSSLMAPKLARRDTRDEPFAWESREFLRKKCIGKEVIFKVDYVVPSINREFGSVFLGETNLALAVVAEGWAKVRQGGGGGGGAGGESPYLAELLNLEEQARNQGLGLWNKEPGAAEAAVRDLPPSGVGQDSGFDVAGLLESSKGTPLPAIIEHVRDGSTVRVLLLPDFQFVQVYVAGIQAPSMGRRPMGGGDADKAKPEANGAAEAANGEAPAASEAPAGGAGGAPSAAQRLALSTAAQSQAESQPEPCAREAKHFTEVRCLNRDVRVVLEGIDGKFNNLIGSVFFPEGDAATDLAPLLVTQGLAKVVDWSASMLEPAAKQKLKAAELEAKRQRLRIWANYVPPQSNSVAIRNDNFTGRVVEVVSGDCIVVADDAAPAGAPEAERRVNLSSIRARKIGNPKREEKPEPFAREAKEFLRSRLVGQQVSVSMEYTRKLPPQEGAASGAEGRNMEFGTVILPSGYNKKEDAGEAGDAKGPMNVAVALVVRGLATVIRHRDFEERSNHYDDLLAAEGKAAKAKKGVHSQKEPPAAHLNDLSTQAATHKAKAFLPFLQKVRRLPAIVDYVLSGHRFKLIIPKEMIAVAFALAGVRCPGRGEPYSEEAIAFMRRRILQHDVEVEVETVDKTGTFIGSLWCKQQNAGVALLDAGLAKLHPTFSPERTADGPQLIAAEQRAKAARLKVWADYKEEEAAPAQPLESGAGGAGGRQEVMQVTVTEVLGGGRLYVVPAAGDKMAQIDAALKGLQLSDKPMPPGTFLPQKGDLVASLFSADNTWARARVVSGPKQGTTGGNAEYEVYYVDFGNQEWVPLKRLRPLEAGTPAASGEGIAQLCSLAHMKVPELSDDFGEEAAQALADLVSNRTLVCRVEDRDTSGGGKARAQGQGTRLIVTLVNPETSTSVNAEMLRAGLGRLEKGSRRDSKEKSAALASLKEHQDEAKKERLCIWQYGDVDSDDEDDIGRSKGPPRR